MEFMMRLAEGKFEKRSKEDNKFVGTKNLPQP